MTANEKKILVVDDEELLRSSLAKFLERKGFQVETAESGNKAYDLLSLTPVDLVLSDVRMPDGDGLSLLERMEQLSGDPPGIMFITGFSDLSVEDFLEKGALHVFNKPVDRQEILVKVKEYFQIDS